MTNPGGRPDLRVGDSGESVTELQEHLQTLGVYLGSCDGQLGERTAAAVHEFALVYHVVEDPDLLVGEQIWTAVLTQTDGGTSYQPVEGQLSDDQAWVWHDGSWYPAPPVEEQPVDATTGAGWDAVGGEHVSEDGHWRWVNGQWQPNR